MSRIFDDRAERAWTPLSPWERMSAQPTGESGGATTSSRLRHRLRDAAPNPPSDMPLIRRFVAPSPQGEGRSLRPLTFLLVLFAFWAAPVVGQTSYPMVSRTHPVAVQRGASSDVTIGGQGDLSGVTSLLFDTPGLSAEILDDGDKAKATAQAKGAKRPAAGTIRVRIHAAKEAPLGPREFRLVTPRGASSVGQLVVVSDPVVIEEEPLNDDPTRGQTIAIPSAIAGVVGKVEDVDWYTLHAEAGQTVVFSLWGNRLQDKIHDLQEHLDPILQLYDESGREIASNDNALFADPRLSHTFKNSGVYKIAVRDTSYEGNPNWSYVLQVSAAPHATTAFPLAVAPGSTAEVAASGFNFDATRPVTVAIPSDVRRGPISLELTTDRGPTAPVPLVATSLPIVIEAGDSPAEIAKAQGVDLPAAIAGRLLTAGDRDGYRFEAKKGRLYRFEVTARRAGSEADPVLRVLNLSGRTMAEADDTPTLGKDSRLEWTAPSDGLFMLTVRDLHDRGGPGFGYVLEAQPAAADFRITCDPDKANVGPGSRVSTFVQVERRGGFTGPVEVRMSSLPQGVSASPLTIPGDRTEGVIVLSAAKEAPLGTTLAAMEGVARVGEETLTRRATPRQETYLPGGGRGLYEVSTLPISVTAPSDITIEAEPREVTLKPGGSATIDVTVTRREGFAGPVELAVNLEHLGQLYSRTLPPGVTVKSGASKTRVGPEATKGTIVLEAAADAPASQPVTICVMGHVSINFVVKTAYCSEPISVRVVK